MTIIDINSRTQKKYIYSRKNIFLLLLSNWLNFVRANRAYIAANSPSRRNSRRSRGVTNFPANLLANLLPEFKPRASGDHLSWNLWPTGSLKGSADDRKRGGTLSLPENFLRFAYGISEIFFYRMSHDTFVKAKAAKKTSRPL